MPALSVTLPDFDALEWTPRSRHLSGVMRAVMGAYVLTVGPTGDGRFEYVTDGPHRLSLGRTSRAGGYASTLEAAQASAHGCAIYMAQSILSDLGGTP